MPSGRFLVKANRLARLRITEPTVGSGRNRRHDEARRGHFSLVFRLAIEAQIEVARLDREVFVGPRLRALETCPVPGAPILVDFRRVDFESSRSAVEDDCDVAGVFRKINLVSDQDSTTCALQLLTDYRECREALATKVGIEIVRTYTRDSVSSISLLAIPLCSGRSERDEPDHSTQRRRSAQTGITNPQH